jgi:hypothetical protein
MCDVFGRADLFRGQPQVEKRIVKWGQNAKPVELPHSAVVISEDVLLERIGEGVEVAPQTVHPDWTIYAGKPLPVQVQELSFGSRMATASIVKLRTGCDAAAAWAESLSDGWLFLISAGEHGWLLAAGAHRDSLLRESCIIQGQLESLEECSREFPASPRASLPMTGSQWLACGTAALAFDPICGEGAGNAVREAILASALIRAALHSRDTESLKQHYQSRLLGGFERHLQICDGFYNTGQGPWWEHERESLRQGLAWCSAERAKLPPNRYRLRGFELEPA